MEQYLLTAAAAFAGGAISALLIIPKALAERSTHSSNRILEMRLEALQKIGDRLNEVIWVVSPSTGLGYEKWKEAHYQEGLSAALDFKKEAERQQVILDKSVVDQCRRVYSAFRIFMDGDEIDDRHQRPRPYTWFVRERLNPELDKLASSVNNTLNVKTHRIALRFTDEAA